MSVFLTPQFFGSILYWQHIIQNDSVYYNPSKRFIKSSRMNRTEIFTANGIQVLTVPVTGGRNIKMTYNDIKISYDIPWQKQHWHALQSAYGKSAFWEFYSHEIELCYRTKFVSLLELNMAGFALILKLLKIQKEFTPAQQTNASNTAESFLFRQEKILPVYFQTFSHKYPFESDLSILDLLFNVGPRSIDYLRNLNLKS